MNGHVYLLADRSALEHNDAHNAYPRPLCLGFFTSHIWAPFVDESDPDFLALPQWDDPQLLYPEVGSSPFYFHREFTRVPSGEFGRGFTTFNLESALAKVETTHKRVAVFLPTADREVVMGILKAVSLARPELKFYYVKQVNWLGLIFLKLVDI